MNQPPHIREPRIQSLGSLLAESQANQIEYLEKQVLDLKSEVTRLKDELMVSNLKVRDLKEEIERMYAGEDW